MYQQQDRERANSEVETCDEQISSVAHLHEGFGARFGNGTQVINHLLRQVFERLSKYRVCHCSAPLWSCQFQYPLQWHFLPQLIFPNKLQVWKKDVTGFKLISPSSLQTFQTLSFKHPCLVSPQLLLNPQGVPNVPSTIYVATSTSAIFG